MNDVTAAPTMLTPQMGVGGHISLADMPRLAEDGFTDIVCNRPESEVTTEPSAEAVQAEAQKLGLSFHYLPIVHGAPISDAVSGLKALLDQPNRKVFAYCRSGARSANAFEMSQAG